LVAMLVAAGLWAQAAAPAAPTYPQWVFNGNFNYGALTNFDDPAPIQFFDFRTIFQTNLDANNFVMIRLRFKDADWTPETAETVQAGIRLDRAFVQSNITGAFGVKGPVAASVMYGVANTKGADVTDGISPYEVSDLSGNDQGDRYLPIIAPWVVINNMITVKAIVTPSDWDVTNVRNNEGYQIDVFGTMNGITAEVAYSQQMAGGVVYARPVKMVFGGAKYAGTSGDLAYAVAANGSVSVDGDAVGFAIRNHYALASNDPTDDTLWGYGLAAMANYKKGMALAKVGLVGVDGSLLNRAEFLFNVAPIPQVAFEIGGVLNLDSAYLRYFNGTTTPIAAGTTFDDVKMLNDLDVAMIINVGKVAYRIGYLYKDKNAPYSVMADDIGRVGDTNKAGTVDEGGAYISCILSF